MILTSLLSISMVKYSICSSLDLQDRLWVIIFTQERAPRQAFTYLKSTIGTLKKWKIFKVNYKTPERLSTVLNLDIIHYFLQCPAVEFEEANACCVPPYQLINAEITYCRNYSQMYENLSEIISKDSQEKTVIQSRAVVP